MVSELVREKDIVVDFGAGRGRQAELGGPHLRRISCFQGRCAKLIGIDPDPIVNQNRVVDEAYIVAPGEQLPLADESVDLIYSYAVFEHVEDAKTTARELARVVKPGGWICAWTPNKWGYVGIGARLTPNKLHTRILNVACPGGRTERDVFPVRYRMNELKTITRLFPGFENYSFGFNAQPSYNFGSSLVARFWMTYMALTPRALSQSLFIFLRKR